MLIKFDPVLLTFTQMHASEVNDSDIPCMNLINDMNTNIMEQSVKTRFEARV